MDIKTKLSIQSFLQFFVWGAWLTTIGTYCFATKGWTFEQFGAIFGTIGLASILFPPIMGIVVDKWINAEKMLGILHFIYGVLMFFIPFIDSPSSLILIVFFAMSCYMPTIALSYSTSYYCLTKFKYDVVSTFPKIRVWGTVGFITAMWLTNFSNYGLDKPSAIQFYIAGAGAIILSVYCFTLPSVPPENKSTYQTLVEKLGLNAFVLFKDKNMAIFFIFSLLTGAALQLSNMYADSYIHSFGENPTFKDSFAVKNSTLIVSISQISETFFILAIPFFLHKFGIKKVILISLFAWFLRFGLFSIGYPSGIGLVAIITSMLVYGMAFDFFNISGSLFVEQSTNEKIRSSAQGLYMMMTNGFGSVLGANLSGFLITNYFSYSNGSTNWELTWFYFALYPLIIAILFAILFKSKLR